MISSALMVFLCEIVGAGSRLDDVGVFFFVLSLYYSLKSKSCAMFRDFGNDIDLCIFYALKLFLCFAESVFLHIGQKSQLKFVSLAWKETADAVGIEPAFMDSCSKYIIPLQSYGTYFLRCIFPQ